MAYKIRELQNSIPQTGKVEWISIRTKKRADVKALNEIELSPAKGLHGDHYAGLNQKRQITLIQKEHLEMVSQILSKTIDPSLTRRNLVISGINLLAFEDHQFQVGVNVILKMTGLCHPCARMEENLGTGGYQAMRGHGGITASVIQGGIIKKGDAVVLLPNLL